MQPRSTIHLQPSNDEIEEEGDDGEQVDEVHWHHQKLQLAGTTREPDLKRGSHEIMSLQTVRLSIVYSARAQDGRQEMERN